MFIQSLSAAEEAASLLIDRLSARVYLGLRSGLLASDDVVELACALLDWCHNGEAVREVVERHPAQVPAREMAELAARILEECCFDPGFDLAPERLEVLRKALGIVARDLPTAGIDGEPQLLIMEDWFPVAAAVQLADGRLLSCDGRLQPSTGDDLPGSVTAVAGLIQDSLLEIAWKVWPVCADHRLGVHAIERSDLALWWCSGTEGHALAPVGTLVKAPGARRRRGSGQRGLSRSRATH
jgi:hypothetical protein